MGMQTDTKKKTEEEEDRVPIQNINVISKFKWEKLGIVALFFSFVSVLLSWYSFLFEFPHGFIL